jgi:hypothetical protein
MPKRAHPNPMYVAQRMNSGDLEVTTLVGKVTIPGSSWLPKGCCGFLPVFRSIEDLQREYGENACYQIIQETTP